MKTFAVFEVPACVPATTEPLKFTEGNAFWCVLSLLDHLTLPQLHALKLSHLHAAQKRVAKATAEACAARVAAEVAAGDWSLDDRIALGDPGQAVDGLVVPPECADLHAECDEDGDEVLEPTPIFTPREITGSDS